MVIKSDSFIYRNESWAKAGFCFLCLTAFLMPFPRSWSLWSLGGLLFFGLTGWITGFKKNLDLFKKYKYVVAPPVFYFCLYFLFFLFSGSSWNNVEDKLMFILVPVFAFPVFASKYFNEKLKYLFISFIFGVLFICLFQIIRVTFESLSVSQGHLVFHPLVPPKVSRYNWDQLSIFDHPTYLAIRILWVISLILFFEDFMSIKKIYKILLVFFFTVFLFLLTVKASLLILIVLLVYFLFRQLKTRSSRIILVLMIPFIAWLFFILARLNSRTSEKIEELHWGLSVEHVDWKNLDPRTRSWYYSFELIKKNPFFGVGLNARNILADEYKKNGFNVESGLRLNSHNQYLETQLTLGIPGTLILLWMLFTPFIRRRRLWNPVLVILFTVIVSVSMFFESILVRQWGIMFFILFYFILTIPDKEILITADR